MGLDGTYRYHATREFPYVLGCYKGTPNAVGGDGAGWREIAQAGLEQSRIMPWSTVEEKFGTLIICRLRTEALYRSHWA